MKIGTALVSNSDSRHYQWPPVAADADDQGSAPLTFDREQLVAENAYFRAERRGFIPGGELSDWFEAEAEVERALSRDS